MAFWADRDIRGRHQSAEAAGRLAQDSAGRRKKIEGHAFAAARFAGLVEVLCPPSGPPVEKPPTGIVRRLR